MFWIGFGAGAGAAFLISLMGFSSLMWSIGKGARGNNEKLYGFWETSTAHQEEQIQVIKDLANQIRG